MRITNKGIRRKNTLSFCMYCWSYSIGNAVLRKFQTIEHEFFSAILIENFNLLSIIQGVFESVRMRTLGYILLVFYLYS